MPSEFDEAFAAASPVFDRVLGAPVEWRPIKRTEGGSYIAGAVTPDPDHAPVDMPAIVSWKPVADVTTNTDGAGAVAGFTVWLDIDRRYFTRPPRRYDQVFLTEEEPGSRLLEVQRVGDDDATRFMLYCNIVKG